jgi:prepilin-type N-terminal cleavage/methylation domain-containing protein
MKRGHSLAELLICLLIILIMAGALLPAVVGAWKAAVALKHKVEGP